MISRGKKGTMQQILEQQPSRLDNGVNIGLFPQVGISEGYIFALAILVCII